VNDTLKWTAEDWFRAAMECHVVEHQGCPCCHEQHCVFRSSWGKRLEFYCSSCEFSACLDDRTGYYHATPGQKDAISASVLDELD
jgi:hypothetical protein